MQVSLMVEVHTGEMKRKMEGNEQAKKKRKRESERRKERKKMKG